MWEYFCIKFVDFKLKSKSLLEYTKLFSPNDYENKDKIILKYFGKLKRGKKNIALFAVSVKKLEKPKISYLLEKKYFLLLSTLSARMKMKKYLKKRIQMRY